MMDKFVLFLTAGTGKLNGFITKDPNNHTDYIINHAKSDNHLSFSPTLGFMKGASAIAKYIDWVALLLALVGFCIVLSSYIGNNGRWRNAGYGLIGAGYSWIIIVHCAIVAGPAFGNLGNMKLMLFLFMLVGQMIVYVGTSTLYMLGSKNYELYEMTGEQNKLRNAENMYGFIKIALFVGFAAYFVAVLIQRGS